MGSVRLLIDDTAEVVNHYTYNPFGALFDTENTETVENPFRFAGYWWDEQFGQYYCIARYYDPALQRFTGRDPVLGKFSEPATLHAYLYCLNDPVNNWDPTGEMTLIELKATTMTTAASIGTAIAMVAQRGLTWAQNIISRINLATVARNIWIRGSDLWLRANIQTDRVYFWFARMAQGNPGSAPAARNAISNAKNVVNSGGGIGGQGQPYKGQQALIQLAKEAKRVGVTREEAKILLEWADEYEVLGLNHINTTHWIGGPHIAIGSQNHIPVK